MGKRWGADWDEQRIAEHNARVAKSRNRNTGGIAEPESNLVNEAQRQDEIKGFDERVDITFTVYRRKLLDPDNNYSKHITDGIVSSGILRNDTSQEIREVRYRQVKIPDWEAERTVVRIEAI